MTSLLTGTASMAASYASILLLLAAAQIFALLLLPSLMPAGAKPGAAAKALYCYLIMGFGVLLMTGSGLPALYGVLMELPFDTRTYLLLLITFSLGGILFLWHDSLVQSVDVASRSVPSLLFRYGFRLVGFGCALVALYSMLLTLLFMPQPLPERWLVLPAILLAYGAILLWTTRTVPVKNRHLQQQKAVKSKPRPSKKR